MGSPKVLYAPVPSHTEKVFRTETYERMLKLFDVTANGRDENFTSEEIVGKAGGMDAVVTGWGTPPLKEDFFEKADKLRIIAHSAGSIKGMLSRDVVDRYILPREICVFSANGEIAYNVAEATVGYLIMTGRRFCDHITAIRTKDIWKDPGIPATPRTLNGSTVGVVSASKVGVETIRLLQPFDLRMIIYDPYLPDWEAGRLNAEKVGLDELFERSDFVTVHAPLIPETIGMIGKRQLGLMKDGAVLVNTARGKVIDHDALFEELKTGRIMALLDVTDPEPLPPDSPLRKLPNVYITPHVSGAGSYGYLKIGDATLRALEDFFGERPVKGKVNFIRYDTLA